MADISGSTTVDADASTLFDYLSDVSHLPDYFARMTEATPGEGEEVHTRAEAPGGTEVEADAWFRVDDEARTIEWGSEGASGYRGRLTVTAAGDGSQVQVDLHTERVSAEDDEVRSGIDETLRTIKRIAETG